MGVHDILHVPESVLVKQAVLGLLEWKINLEIASLFLDEITQVHAIRDGLDAASDHHNQVLKNQGRQVNLVVGPL